jgi:cell division protease FtsH
VYGVVSTGAEADLRMVTGIAREMVVRWGMSSKVGAVNYAEEGGTAVAYGAQHAYSDATAELIDFEVKRISDECLAHAVELLELNRAKLDALAHALLEHDTLSESEILGVTGLAASSDAESEAPALVAPST